MSKTLKNVGLVLIIFLVALVIFNLFSSPSPSSKTDSQLYADYLEDQKQTYRKHIEQQNIRTEALLTVSENQQVAYDKLLHRWNSQADRMDALLSKWEHGTIPAKQGTL